MTAPFAVRITPKVERLLKKFTKSHPDLPARLAKAIGILKADPYNVSRTHANHFPMLSLREKRICFAS